MTGADDERAAQPDGAAVADPPPQLQAGDPAPDGSAPATRHEGDEQDGWEYEDPPPVQTGDETPPTA